MHPVNILPADYQPIRTLDITKDRQLQIFLSLGALLVMILSGWLFLRVAVLLRAGDSLNSPHILNIGSLLDLVVLVGAILVLILFNTVLHEAIHGLFFWLFTRSRPRFAFRWTYAYAAAPGWFLPRGQFIVTTLAPLVLITLIGLLVLKISPIGWLLPVWFIITMNAGGAVGDMLVAVLLLLQPKKTLVEDCGDKLTFYRKRGPTDPAKNS